MGLEQGQRLDCVLLSEAAEPLGARHGAEERCSSRSGNQKEMAPVARMRILSA